MKNERKILLAIACCALTLILNSLCAAQLVVSSRNPRYFVQRADTTRAVYLAGSHVFAGFMDQGDTDPPPSFNYTAYLNFLNENNHNFFRFWTAWTSPKNGPWQRSGEWYYNTPQPWRRTGPDSATDGKPKFNFDSLDQNYFGRLHARVDSAQRRGIYVSIMFFNAFDMSNQKGGSPGNPGMHSPWRLVNNVNGINGDPNGDLDCAETNTYIPAVWAIQERYIKTVIDSVNEFDNVLYEVCNESNGGPDEVAWQERIIDTVHSYESRKPKQHPVGFTVPWPGGINSTLFNSNADWVSPNSGGGYETDPPITDTSKIIINDTDHLCGICGNRGYVWRSFLRGLNFLFSDSYDGRATGSGANWGFPGYDSSNANDVTFRHSIGYTRSFATRMKLLDVRPRNSLASTNYCLQGGREWLVYQPASGSFTVDVSTTQDSLNVEWLDIESGAVAVGARIAGGSSNLTMTPPFAGDVALYLYPGQAAPLLASPPNGAAGQPDSLPLVWHRSIGASTYHLQLSLDAAFTSLTVDDSTIVDSTRRVGLLTHGNTYYWRVRALSGAGASDWSQTWSFSVIVSLPAQVQLQLPPDMAGLNVDTARFVWYHSSPAVTRYWFELSTDSLFATGFVDSMIVDTTTVVHQLVQNQLYWWKVRSNNAAGWGPFSQPRRLIVLLTSLGTRHGLPTISDLSPNYPNPFNPTTTIRYQLAKQSRVIIKIYNLLGEEIRIMIDTEQAAGYYSLVWNGADDLGHPVSSGAYFYRAQLGDKTQTRKMIFLK